MNNTPFFTLKHVNGESQAATVYLQAISVQLGYNESGIPYLRSEVTEGEDRRESWGGKVYLINAQGKTIDVFHLDN